jgi:hypothetical protein
VSDTQIKLNAGSVSDYAKSDKFGSAWMTSRKQSDAVSESLLIASKTIKRMSHFPLCVRFCIGGQRFDINRPTVEALKQIYQFDRAKVQFQDVAIADAAPALSSGRVQALLAVVPLIEKYLAKVRQFFQQAGAKGSAPKLIEIGSAVAVANVAQARTNALGRRAVFAELPNIEMTETA